MTRYEELACRYDDVHIKELELQHNFKGLYRNSKIIIERRLTSIEKKCLLGEELGHHFTSSGNIIDQRNTNNRKQERLARGWGYGIIIPLSFILEGVRECAYLGFMPLKIIYISGDYHDEGL